MPLPPVHTYGPDLRYYLAHSVEGLSDRMACEVLFGMRALPVACVDPLQPRGHHGCA